MYSWYASTTILEKNRVDRPSFSLPLEDETRLEERVEIYDRTNFTEDVYKYRCVIATTSTIENVDRGGARIGGEMGLTGIALSNCVRWRALRGNQPGSTINVINIPLMPVPLRNRFTSLLHTPAAHGERPLAAISRTSMISYVISNQPHLAASRTHPQGGGELTEETTRGVSSLLSPLSLSIKRVAWENGARSVYY